MTILGLEVIYMTPTSFRTDFNFRFLMFYDAEMAQNLSRSQFALFSICRPSKMKNSKENFLRVLDTLIIEV